MTEDLERLVASLARRANKTENGFADIRQAAQEVVANHSPAASAQVAQALYRSESYQSRSLATYIFGHLAAHSASSLRFLRTRVSRDADWRVQEILAQAFDAFCASRGYEPALAVTRDWLADRNPNVRRAVTEGLRIWTSRPYYREHPEIAIEMLSRLKSDESEYVRRSVGNALRDISKKHRELVRTELAQWDLSMKGVEQTFKLAGKFLK